MAGKTRRTSDKGMSSEDVREVIVNKLKAVLKREVPCDSTDKKLFAVKLRGRVQALDEAISEVSAMKL